jgi:cbb3-type cytochrome oxidase subunit 3
MSEVCQPGVDDWGLPSWCVDYDLGVGSILQLALELLLLIIIFSVSYAYFDWRKKKKKEKEMISKMNSEKDDLNGLNENGRFN